MLDVDICKQGGAKPHVDKIEKGEELEKRIFADIVYGRPLTTIPL